MVNRKLDIDSEEFKEHVKLFESGLLTQKEIAKKWNVTNSYISNIFLENLRGKPIRNKKKNDEKNAIKIKKLLEQECTVEEIMEKFPSYFSGEEQFKRWVKNNIGEEVLILNNHQKSKRIFDNKVVNDVKLGYSTSVILKKYDITRSQLRAIIYRVTEENSLKKVREKLNGED